MPTERQEEPRQYQVTAAYSSTSAGLAERLLSRSRGIAVCFVRLRTGRVYPPDRVFRGNNWASNLEAGPVFSDFRLLVTAAYKKQMRIQLQLWRMEENNVAHQSA